MARLARRAAALAAAGFTALAAMPASAQSINPRFIETIIPFTYDRGRNESVADRPHPDYAPVGIRAGAFSILPRVETGLGYTDNVFEIEDNKKSDGFVFVNPSITALSNWSLHSLQFDAGANIIRYFDKTTRNEEGWYLGSSGRLDINGNSSLNVGARTARQYESRFYGAALPNVREANEYQASTIKALGDYRFNRIKLVGAVDYSRFDYKKAETFTGFDLNQNFRDRDIYRVAGQAEYGVTPDTGLFIQAAYTNTDYDDRLAGGARNRNSNEIVVIGGVSFDLSALIRGSFGIGYTDRDYSSSAFNDIRGLSLDSKIEYFPTELTTVTLALRREIEDSAFGGSSGYFNTGGTLRVDHELRRNFLLNAAADYEVDTYRGISGKGKIFRASAGGRYLANRLFSLLGTASYGKRTSDSFLNGIDVEEFRAVLGVAIHR